nr:thiamine diphosphokinase [Lachnospiraceae bacterium]
PCEKDDTDTCYAMKECIERGFDEFLFAGVIGERFDHSFGNISLLVKLNELRKKAVIIDDYSEMSIIPREGCIIKGDNIAYFSIISLSDSLKGVTISDAKYTLDEAEIKSNYQYGISNEIIDNNPAKVYCKEGNALLIKIFR